VIVGGPPGRDEPWQPAVEYDALLIALNGIAGVAALGGTWYALAGASGVPTEWLRSTPLKDYRLPGMFLGGVTRR
jgi:hypothetical protein